APIANDVALLPTKCQRLKEVESMAAAADATGLGERSLSKCHRRLGRQRRHSQKNRHDLPFACWRVAALSAVCCSWLADEFRGAYCLIMSARCAKPFSIATACAVCPRAFVKVVEHTDSSSSLVRFWSPR